VDPLVVGHVRHVPLGGDLPLGLDVGQAQRQPGLADRTRDPLAGAVGEHHDQHAVDALVLELAHHALDVRAVAGRRLDDAVDPLERVRHVAEVAALPLRDVREHAVVELLHDPDHADAGGTIRHGWPFPQCWP
jgi:hypothetical protein